MISVIAAVLLASTKSAFLTMTPARPSGRMRMRKAAIFFKGGALEMKTSSLEQVAGKMIGEVEPVLRKYAAQAEADRRLAPEAIDAILDVT